MKPLAKELLRRFRSLAGALSAAPDSLLAIPGTGEASVAASGIQQNATRHIAIDGGAAVSIPSGSLADLWW